MRELMTHTAGFTYGFFGNTPVDKMYRDANLLASKNLQEFIDKLAKIPLLYQPGQGWTYSMSMDIQGYIVEKLSGKSLPDFLRDNIYTPLGMRDAGFFVPADKRNRFAMLYRAKPEWRIDCRSQRQPASRRLRRAATHALRRRRHGFHRRRLLPLRNHAGERRRTGWQAHSRAGDGQADDLEPCSQRVAHRQIRHRLPR